MTVSNGERAQIVGLGGSYDGLSVTVEEVRGNGKVLVRKDDGTRMELPSKYVVACTTGASTTRALSEATASFASSCTVGNTIPAGGEVRAGVRAGVRPTPTPAPTPTPTPTPAPTRDLKTEQLPSRESAAFPRTREDGAASVERGKTVQLPSRESAESVNPRERGFPGVGVPAPSPSFEPPCLDRVGDMQLLGEFGATLFMHFKFCPSYVLAERQPGGKCCEQLVGEIDMTCAVSSDNACCGTTFRITVLRNGAALGYLDCHNVAFLAPLIQAGAITLSAHIPDKVIHFPGAHGPPVIMRVRGSLAWLQAHKQDPSHRDNINSLMLLLGTSDNDFYEEFDLNEEAILEIRDPAASGRQCTCNDEKQGCFIHVAMDEYWSGKGCSSGSDEESDE